jgi:hypothetical protein
MSPYIVMVLTGLSAGLLVPAIAICAAKLGICDPFSLEIAGKTWTFSRNRRGTAANTTVRFESHGTAANTAIRFESHMSAPHVYEQHGRSALSVTTFKLAA